MDVGRRRIALAAVAVVMALAVVPALSASPAPTTPTRGSAPPASGEQYAIQVLDSAPIPPGATAWTAPPPAVLDAGFMGDAVSGLVDLDALYLVGDPALTGPLASWVVAHLPRGAAESGYGSFSEPAGVSEGFEVDLPTSGPNDYLAQLDYQTTEAGGGAYVLRIDALVVWVPDRWGSGMIPLPNGAELTGYTEISPAQGSRGPVSVQLDKAESARLAAAVNALPLAPQVTCAEDNVLYTITLHPSAATAPTFTVSGFVCGGTVNLSAGATRLSPLNDGGCTLLRAVIAVLPAQAAGTRSAGTYC